MRFIIQVNNDNQIQHDFSLALINSIEYDKWRYGKESNLEFDVFNFNNQSIPKGDYIPIGSVEFVSSCLETLYGLRPKPKNIPAELFPFAKRKITNGKRNDIRSGSFIKSNDLIKQGFTGVYNGEQIPDGNYQISDIIDIISEYRVFVYNKEIVGIKNYSGDFRVLPNFNAIEKMISSYKSQPIAFTLDVAITTNWHTVPIEVHDFFSCGLYGFNRVEILPYMFSNWFYQYTKGSR